MVKVCFLASGDQGGGRSRSFWPAEAIVGRASEGLVEGVEVFSTLKEPEPGSVDVLITHRPINPSQIIMVLRHKRAGTRVLVDEDDDISNLPPDFGVQIPTDLLQTHDECIRQADGLVASTQHVADVYGPLARKTWVCRNFIPAWVAGRQFFKKDESVIRVGWTGVAQVHKHDARWIQGWLDGAMNDATLLHIGDAAALQELHYGGPKEHHTYQSTPERYYSLMARADIGIVPLDPTWSLNHGKSWLKANEFAMLGKPVVATKLPEQERFIEHGVSGFLAETPQEFVSYIGVLLRNRDLRVRMGEAAQRRAFEVAEQEPKVWARMVEEALGERKRRKVRKAKVAVPS